MKVMLLEERYGHLSDAEIEAIIEAEDHRTERDEAMNGDYVHIYWDCMTCDVESLAKNRLHAAEAELPGNLPSIGAFSMRNIRAEDLKVGSFARHSGLPGANTSYYVECLAVSVDEGSVEASWVRTNSEDAPFAVVYPAALNIDVVEPLKFSA